MPHSESTKRHIREAMNNPAVKEKLRIAMVAENKRRAKLRNLAADASQQTTETVQKEQES